MLHEGLHGYFEFNGVYSGNALRQHELMGLKYVDLLRASLQSVYPNLSDPDANSLILYEMRDIATTTPTDFTALAAYYKVTTSTITNTGNAYISGSVGTNGCAP